jgi:hypothetical protein
MVQWTGLGHEICHAEHPELGQAEANFNINVRISGGMRARRVGRLPGCVAMARGK